MRHSSVGEQSLPLISTQKLLWLRLLFTFFCAAHITLSICDIWLRDARYFRQICWYVPNNYFNLVSLPYHTILVSTKKPDMVYGFHLYGVGVALLFSAISHCHHNRLDWAIYFGILTIVYYVYSVPTQILYLRNFEKATKIFCIDPNTRRLQTVNSDTLFRRLTSPWIVIFTLRILSTLTRVLLQVLLHTNVMIRGSFQERALDYFFYVTLLWYEIYMYLQLTTEKTKCSYLCRSKNRFEQTYFAFITMLMILCILCLIFCFYDETEIWPLVAIQEIGHVIKVSRLIVLWHYAKHEMNSVDLVDAFADAKMEDCQRIPGRRSTLEEYIGNAEPLEGEVEEPCICTSKYEEEPITTPTCSTNGNTSITVEL